jgi:hypothetical protein
MVDKEQFKKWCESGFKEFAGSRRDAVKYGLSVGLLDFDVAVIRKIAGLASHNIRPNKITPETKAAIIEEHGRGDTMRTIAARHSVSPSIVCKIVHKEKDDEQQ